MTNIIDTIIASGYAKSRKSAIKTWPEEIVTVFTREDGLRRIVLGVNNVFFFGSNFTVDLGKMSTDDFMALQ